MNARKHLTVVTMESAEWIEFADATMPITGIDANWNRLAQRLPQKSGVSVHYFRKIVHEVCGWSHTCMFVCQKGVIGWDIEPPISLMANTLVYNRPVYLQKNLTGIREYG
jgi:hypothetical protein